MHSSRWIFLLISMDLSYHHFPQIILFFQIKTQKAKSGISSATYEVMEPCWTPFLFPTGGSFHLSAQCQWGSVSLIVVAVSKLLSVAFSLVRKKINWLKQLSFHLGQLRKQPLSQMKANSVLTSNRAKYHPKNHFLLKCKLFTFVAVLWEARPMRNHLDLIDRKILI